MPFLVPWGPYVSVQLARRSIVNHTTFASSAYCQVPLLHPGGVKHWFTGGSAPSLVICCSTRSPQSSAASQSSSAALLLPHWSSATPLVICGCLELRRRSSQMKLDRFFHSVCLSVPIPSYSAPALRPSITSFFESPWTSYSEASSAFCKCLISDQILTNS